MPRTRRRTKVDVNDPLWESILYTKLRTYIEPVRNWWQNIGEHSYAVGVTQMDDSVNGLYIRVTRSALRSPIPGIQAFPFVLSARLQLSQIVGGCTKMVERVCMDNKLCIDEFTIVCKSNLPSLFSGAQFLAFIPTALLTNGNNDVGRWFYIQNHELALLRAGVVSAALKQRLDDIEFI